MSVIGLVTSVQLAHTEVTVPAFPGAEGYGALARGGRGGRIFEVTNRNNSGPGSLRAAIDATGPRIVVFRVGGTILLDSPLRIINPFITIAGQTAPGDGIAMSSRTSGSTVFIIETNDVILRYLRIRPGPGGKADGISMARSGANNIIIDHCSISWSVDENIGTYKAVFNVSIQWSIIAEALHCSTHPEGCHSMGMLLGSEGNRISVHHNLFAHNNGRNPRIATTGIIDVVNNIIYNPKSHGGWAPSHASRSARVNYVGNYYKPGLDSNTANYYVSASGEHKIFLQGNITPLRPSDNGDEVSGVIRNSNQGWIVSSRHPVPFVTTTSAFAAYEQVLANAGSNANLTCNGTFVGIRDTVDTRVVNDVRNGTGRIINTPSQVGGWPVLVSGIPCADRDHDGMPDVWEAQHGLDPNDPSDGPADGNGDGYTNVEAYLNGTVLPIVRSNSPTNLRVIGCP